ncbi:MAG: hypothetical protein KGR26_08060, partial [Cyanobacteria bacterium REEB65]|nr:hypothetical protein [Cyanobacteria bacterium REEB65]
KDGSGNTISLLSRRELLAQKVTLQSGSTLILGGLTQTNKIENKSKWPLLGDIPFLGTLFSTTTTEDDDTELLISVTPRILPTK